MNNLFRSITLLLLMFILGSVSAQNQSLNVKGTVRDAMGDPIIGATILQQVRGEKRSVSICGRSENE